ncbi:enoyl-CoA hydratase/isomerase family protein [Parahaliea mediterranea]|uniref:3-hydroxyisobutyryl-CoA hydrolase n=1 Tax=Parahaliea mediterranea TaxID=651086 RepID=A0A939IK58_9GAMM|nr:enoyl-CoA hydratase/isomerase family protein [Parahaliea mediterranea]MBN7796996.1 enoyl-CoA hydratase/isomerase family protein [Parahaliea mediterranea]
MSDAPIVFEELPANAGRIGRVTLNVPGTLNSLTLEMVDLLQAQLDEWRDDEHVAAVFIEGSGDKAFCAGGDVQALHRSAVATPGGPCEYAEDFFTREYRMNHTLHTYPKPLVCWGHGIVMGGGLGVMAGCGHRVVTETTRIAMPEVTIALFPDVGGSWFLNHMPGSTGLFLALTGASINAADALFTGLADRFIASEHKPDLIERLLKQDWSHDPRDNHKTVRHCLRPFAERSLGSQPAGQVEPHMATINRLCDGDDVHQVIDNIIAQQTDDPWLARARDSLAHGSKLAALWIHRQLWETRHASLREVFQAEAQLATNVVRHPEFAEGVRALLIDKDRKPAWQYATSRDVPEEVLEGFFRAPWPANPLADL